MRALALAITVFATTAHADEATPLSFADALRAAASAPAIGAHRHDVAAADALVEAAGAWGGPSLRVETNRLTARIVAGASLPLPIFGTLGAARRVATTNADVVRAETIVDARDVVHRIATAWIALARADGERAAAKVAIAQAEQIEHIARERLANGAGAEVDLGAATAAHARATAAEASARRRQEAASAMLAGLLGRDPLVMLVAAGEVPGRTAPSITELQSGLRAHPRRAIVVDRISVARASAAEARTSRLPSLAVEGQVSMRDPGTPGTDVLVALTLDLPLFGHASDRIRAATATADAEGARLAALDSELSGGLVAAYRRWQDATETVTALENVIVPAQEKAASLAAQAWREGARELVTALQADRDLAATRAELVAARADAALAWIDVQDASGREIGGAGAH